MLDIVKLLERKRKEQIADYFMQLQLMIASNNRALEKDDYSKFIRNLTKNLEGEKQETSKKLDREKLEALRFMSNMGANKTGGR